MNYTINERGERIIASGHENSPIRMLEKFPDSMPKAIDLIKKGKQMIEIWSLIPNVKTEDKLYFLQACLFYVKKNKL